VQGYAYAARLLAAELAAALGDDARARALQDSAVQLRGAFDREFWIDELGTYALALDGDRRPCRVRTSNAGHALFTGIALPERAERLTQTLMAEDSWTGWGIRTLSTLEQRFNPMSYHNGSVWPHDNALIALGLSRYGRHAAARQLFQGLLDASRVLDLHRLPELFCGFPRRPGEGPTLYPVACSPQAWAIAAVYVLLEACLGLRIDGVRRQLIIDHPSLPEPLDWVTVRNLAIPGAAADMTFHRRGRDQVGIEIGRVHGDLQVSICQ
jgi:glycogen debranching enzyme